jgi:hypothetical protein
MLSKRVEIEGRRIPLISLDTCMSASNAKVNRKNKFTTDVKWIHKHLYS